MIIVRISVVFFYFKKYSLSRYTYSTRVAICMLIAQRKVYDDALKRNKLKRLSDCLYHKYVSWIISLVLKQLGFHFPFVLVCVRIVGRKGCISGHLTFTYMSMFVAYQCGKMEYFLMCKRRDQFKIYHNQKSTLPGS